MTQSTIERETRDPDAEQIFKLLSRLGMWFEIAVSRSDILEPGPSPDHDPLERLFASARQAGIVFKESELVDVDEAAAFLREGYPLVVAHADGTFTVVDSRSGGQCWATTIHESASKEVALSRSGLRNLLFDDTESRVLVTKKQLDLDSISAAPYHSTKQSGETQSPLRRFIGLLQLESSDIWTVILFAFVSGVLTLATPLAVESLVNVVSWGTYMQPLIVLGVILFTCLGIAGVLRVLQTFVVELIQRRQFVRIVSDLAHRFPRVKRSSLSGAYPRELANRVFDIMTIQKATAVLLLDGVSIVLTTFLGLILLAFYHPILLGFDIVLVISMISVTWLLGGGGMRTAIDESVAKYRVAHWLQDVLALPAAFKSGGGEYLAVVRANQLTADYINTRKRQFNVVIRQSAFAISVQVIASTAVLALGGWLVVQRQLTLGQLVASELVVTVVVGAFAKAGKSLEKFYDLMAGMDKVGTLIDLPADPSQAPGASVAGPVDVAWSDLLFQRPTSTSRIPAVSIDSGRRVAIVGNDIDGRSDVARSLAGLGKPSSGTIQIGGFDARDAANTSGLVGYAGSKHVFHGSLRENVDMARMGITVHRVREVLAHVGLTGAMLELPEGIQTDLQTDGYPLADSEVAQLVIARAIAPLPSLLVIEGLLDEMSDDVRQHIWKTLAAPDAPWTLVVTTNRESVASLCDTRINIARRPLS